MKKIISGILVFLQLICSVAFAAEIEPSADNFSAVPFADEVEPPYEEGVPQWSEQFEEPLVGWKYLYWDGTKNVPSEEDIEVGKQYRITPKTPPEDFSSTNSLEAFASKNVYYKKLPDWATNRVIEVWFYDDLANTRANGKQVRISARVGSALIGINNYDNAPAEYDEYYCADTGNLTTLTSIKRSTGWHRFLFDYTTVAQDNTVRLYIDDVQVFVGTPGASDDLSGNAVALGSEQDRSTFGSSLTTPDTGLYFDNLLVWKTMEDTIEKPDIPDDVIAPYFEETFENFSFTGWDRLEWDSAQGQNAPTSIPADIQNAAITTEQPHGGNKSLKIVRDKLLFHYELPGEQITDKVVEVWFYDDGKSAFDNKRTRIGAYVGATYIGVNELSPASGLDENRANHYSTRIYGKDNSFVTSNIERSVGWHQFLFDYSAGNGQVRLLIDGQVAATGTIPESQSRSINKLVLGDENSDDGNTSNLYFDDLRVWNKLSDMPSSTSALQKDGVTFPDGTPVDGAQLVPLNSKTFHLAFSQNILDGTFTVNNVELKFGNAPLPVESVTKIDTKNYQVTFKDDLVMSKTYTLTIKGGYDILYVGKQQEDVVCTFTSLRPPIDTDSLSVVDIDGNTVTSLANQTTLTANASVHYSGEEGEADQSISLYLALYQKNEDDSYSMVRMSRDNQMVPVNTNQKDFTCSLDVTGLTSSEYYVKAFVWNQSSKNLLISDIITIQ